MTERYESSDEFYEMMENDILKENLEEIRMNKEAEQRAIDMEIGEEIDELLADQRLEDVKLAEKGQ